MSAWREWSVSLSFDHLAEYFDEHRGLPRGAVQAWTNLVTRITDSRTLRVVEPGIGGGRITLPLAALGHRVWGCDVSPSMVEQCHHTAAAIGIADRVEVVVADATDLPLPDAAADLGVVAQLLYLVPDWPAVLDELARVVKPGGYVIHLTEPTRENEALQVWNTTWREMIEETGYRHRAFSPTDAEVSAEFLRRWPDCQQELLASWSFGQSVGEARRTLRTVLRPLYETISDDTWHRTVDRFLAWSETALPDDETDLGGTISLAALIART